MKTGKQVTVHSSSSQSPVHIQLLESRRNCHTQHTVTVYAACATCASERQTTSEYLDTSDLGCALMNLAQLSKSLSTDTCMQAHRHMSIHITYKCTQIYIAASMTKSFPVGLFTQKL